MSDYACVQPLYLGLDERERGPADELPVLAASAIVTAAALSPSLNDVVTRLVQVGRQPLRLVQPLTRSPPPHCPTGHPHPRVLHRRPAAQCPHAPCPDGPLHPVGLPRIGAQALPGPGGEEYPGEDASSPTLILVQLAFSTPSCHSLTPSPVITCSPPCWRTGLPAWQRPRRCSRRCLPCTGTTERTQATRCSRPTSKACTPRQVESALISRERPTAPTPTPVQGSGVRGLPRSPRSGAHTCSRSLGEGAA